MEKVFIGNFDCSVSEFVFQPVFAIESNREGSLRCILRIKKSCRRWCKAYLSSLVTVAAVKA